MKVELIENQDENFQSVDGDGIILTLSQVKKYGYKHGKDGKIEVDIPIEHFKGTSGICTDKTCFTNTNPPTFETDISLFYKSNQSKNIYCKPTPKYMDNTCKSTSKRTISEKLIFFILDELGFQQSNTTEFYHSTFAPGTTITFNPYSDKIEDLINIVYTKGQKVFSDRLVSKFDNFISN